ncbi:MAG: hypothetical protein KF912_13220 [Phycisphaeraceae bacterium]|nr:hypothetical protein [Phycisphaeraceae bacterium]MBX3368266.1 hypothetical protein [Phycisphaeraceae bacterium]
MAVSVQEHGFEAEATIVLRDLRRCVARVLGDLRPCVRASALATELGLDRSLGWKIWTLAQGASTNPSPKHVPGRAGFQTFLDAASRAGASEPHVDEARQAFARFEELSKSHARDRASAEIMLGALTSEGRGRLELSLRRNAFRANAHFLGVQCDTLFQADVVAPDAGGGMPRVARVRGHYGLTRMRSGVSWVLSRSTMVTPDGKTGAYTRRPLGEIACEVGFAPVSAAFSTSPLPVVARHLVDGVVYQDELEAGPVGLSRAVDVVIGEAVENIPSHGDEEDAVTARISTPCERFCYDVMLHESIASRGEPRIEVFTTIHSDLPYVSGTRDRIPVTEELELIGTVDEATPAAEVPRHADLVSWMLGSIGERADSYRLYRLRMRFPPLPTVAAATYRLR